MRRIVPLPGLNIRPYEARDAEAWDALIDGAPNATFLHSRRFLAYHGERFRDASLVIEQDGAIKAVFPAARDPEDPTHVVSHPGATYGGLVAPGFTAHQTIEAFERIAAHYQGAGCSRLTYKTIPYHVTAVPSEADRYALMRLGATVARRDLWSLLSLAQPDSVSYHLARQLKVAARHDLVVLEDASDAAYRRYHGLLAANLDDRHGIRPVHTAEELIDLRDRLQAKVALWLVTAGEEEAEPLAGIWLFRLGRIAWHTQYIASSPLGREKRAMHFLMHRLISMAREAGVRWLSYGAITEQEGRVLNPGLERFKTEFGGGHVVHDFFDLPLAGAVAGEKND